MEPFRARAYFLCADARTGSSLLAGTLRTTQRAGKPHEYFGLAEIDKPWMRKDELGVPEAEPFTTFRNWRHYILRAGSEYGGVFGATVHWFQLGAAVETFTQETDPQANAGPQAIDSLRAFFPELRLIWLRRRNRVAQAVSHYVAIQSNVWNVSSLDPNPRLGVDRRVPYDFAAIDWQVQSAAVADAGWRATLGGAQDILLKLTYEDLCSDLPGAVSKVLAHLGVPAQGLDISAPLVKQAGPWSAELERLYRRERAFRRLGPVGDEPSL